MFDSTFRITGDIENALILEITFRMETDCHQAAFIRNFEYKFQS